MSKKAQGGNKRGASEKFDMQSACLKTAPKLFKELKNIALAPGVRRSQSKLSAIRELLDRGFGKSKEILDASGFIDSFAELVKAAGEKENGS